MAVECREIKHGSEEYNLEIDLRFRVLRQPLGLDFDPEQLELEAGEWHIGAFDGSVLVGCLVLVPKHDGTVKMRQVAVDPHFQGRGIGRSMVSFSEQFAVERGSRFMELNARNTAVPFYISLGYLVEDDEFIEVGIPHRRMVKSLIRVNLRK